jgi:hypothetical protein
LWRHAGNGGVAAIVLVTVRPRVLVTAAVLTVLATVAFCLYMGFGAMVCGATGSSCGGYGRLADIALLAGGLLAAMLLALACRRPPFVIPGPDLPAPPSHTDGPYR